MDHQFHLLCLQNPHAAIKQLSGKEIPKEAKIRFVDESSEMVLMLPAEHKQLTEQEIGALASGYSYLVFHLDIPQQSRIEL